MSLGELAPHLWEGLTGLAEQAADGVGQGDAEVLADALMERGVDLSPMRPVLEHGLPHLERDAMVARALDLARMVTHGYVELSLWTGVPQQGAFLGELDYPGYKRARVPLTRDRWRIMQANPGEDLSDHLHHPERIRAKLVVANRTAIDFPAMREEPVALSRHAWQVEGVGARTTASRLVIEVYTRGSPDVHETHKLRLQVPFTMYSGTSFTFGRDQVRWNMPSDLLIDKVGVPGLADRFAP